ncbi:squalene synthase [Halalkalibacter wakoensis JCM 9140]|uniref:Squalene synthase n=1 Tax=Halalkalibacter wakoensis JCM 9140 TaxID=1236970 RepID=W4Q8N1_9BACI|nr:phytoene desaturase family protein [Halalkalibacter wakoensis]GAE27759.1 squalene synthase [Halalkalibacter wakoensis JCM 9140]
MKNVIVGGGVGGMITALYLNKMGEEVTILEEKSRLGGRLAFVEQEGYKIDEGPTIVLLPHMIKEILSEVDISEDEYELVRVDPLYKLSYPDGSHFMKWSDTNKQLAEISQKYSGEEAGFEQYLTEMHERFNEGKKAFLDKSFVQKREFWTMKNVKTLYKLKAYRTVKQLANDYFTHQRLIEAFSFQTLYIGGAPFQSPALYSLVPFSEHVHGIWYVKGGYASLVELFERKLRERGVEILLNKKVEQIKTRGQISTGVMLEGEHMQADRVIFNGDFPLMNQLVKEKKKEKYIPSSGCLLIYLGLNQVYKEANVHQFLMNDDLEEHMREVFVSKQLPKNPSIYAFHPSIIDPTLAPEGKGVLYLLIPVPAGESVKWDQIDDYVDRLIEKVESRAFPGLRNAIEWKKIRTPADAQVDGLYQGGSFGIAPTLTQSGVFRPQLKPYPYENVYAVGASIHPGGGVPIVMQGAKLLANHIKQTSVRKGGDIELHRSSI